jgi:hypothetical protein
MDDLVGRTLGQYRIIEQLGRGGMAEVYKAYQAALDRYVAVKVLHPLVGADEQFLARFQREAKAVAALRHPNIVQIHDFGHEADRYYMVMEFVEGQTLKHRLDSLQRAGTHMPLDEVMRIMAEVCSALAYAHQRGMIHRDVKPANVLLSAEGHAVLSDFGIAYMVEGTRYTLTGVIGTPDYMSPEQGMGQPVDARSDIYSLGVMLYEILTGRVPFSADTPMAVIFKHVQNPLPMPRSINPAISEAVERVVLKALSKNPDDRFATTGQMAEALRAALAAGAPAVEITPPSEPASTAVFGPRPVPTDAALPSPPTARAAARPAISRSLIAGGALALVGIGVAALLVAGGVLWFLLRGREQGMAPAPVVASATPTPVATPPTPEPAPATPVSLRPRPNGPLVFEDDFSDGAQGARPLFADWMAFDYADGRGRLTGQVVGGVLPALYSAPKLADFYAEFDVEASAAVRSDSGFIFRSDDAEGGLAWYYLLGLHPAQGTAGLMCWRNHEWVVNREFTLPPGLLKPTGVNHVRVEAVGGEFRVFLNGTFAFAAADSTLVDAGIFGFYIVPAAKQGDFIYFDNLHVYGPR